MYLLFTVPIPDVKINISEYETYTVSEYESFRFTVREDAIILNVTLGDPLVLDCNVTTIRGISSSVDIIWTTEDRTIRKINNITADIVNDSAIYTDSFEISSLSAIDNGRNFQCIGVINAKKPVNNTDQITLNFRGEYN